MPKEIRNIGASVAGRAQGKIGGEVPADVIERWAAWGLQNVLERVVIISRDGQLRLELPDAEPARAVASNAALKPTTGILTEQQKRQRDRAMIVQALALSGGKVFGPGGAAELLEVKPTTLASRIKRWGIVYEG